MTNYDLVSSISGYSGLSKDEAARLLESLKAIIAVSLKNQDDVAIAGFGKFSRSVRSARIGRNPRTGESVTIPLKVVTKFKPSKTLVDSVNRAWAEWQHRWT